MIQVQMVEEDAVSLHDIIQRLRRIMPEVSDDLRGVELTLSGALRGAGWTPGDTEGSWVKQAHGRRR